MHGTLVRKFLDLMQEYQAMLTKYDKKFRDKAYKEDQIGTHTTINTTTRHTHATHTPHTRHTHDTRHDTRTRTGQE